jgi:hypothetical protein
MIFVSIKPFDKSIGCYKKDNQNPFFETLYLEAKKVIKEKKLGENNYPAR